MKCCGNCMTSHLILPAVPVHPLALGLWVPVRENISKAQIPQKDPRSVAGEAWTMGTTTPGKTNPHVAQAGLGVQPSALQSLTDGFRRKGRPVHSRRDSAFI